MSLSAKNHASLFPRHGILPLLLQNDGLQKSQWDTNGHYQVWATLGCRGATINIKLQSTWKSYEAIASPLPWTHYIVTLYLPPPNLFLIKGIQAPTSLKSPKPTEFQLSSCCEPDRGEAWAFLKDLHWVLTFCFPLSFSPLPGLGTLCSCVYLWENVAASLPFCLILFFPNLVNLLCMKLSFPFKDLDFWEWRILTPRPPGMLGT